ncbi:hypothetical protein LTR64_004998 [Lithohypha guttulata]|uniref:uncharacterized protein n=1 Tax=Lithohypha guttulata TaxID=1690604 RepID=UPI002DDDED1D|nr:hypothetical protein LTR51_005165 [Lithohypha guttulata]
MQRHPARQAFVEDGDEATERGISLAELPIDRNYDLPAGAGGAAPERASALLSQFDRKRRAAQLAVPTDDAKVRIRLRELGEPITLFGEGPADRRNRLRELMLVDEEEHGAASPDVQMQDAEDNIDQEEEFYTEGLKDLLKARQEIARYSLPRAQARVARQKEESSIPLRTHIKHRKAIKEKLQGFELFGTQIAGDRPVSITRFAPNGEIVAAGNWSGGIKLLSVPNLEEKRSLRGHTGIVGGISWFPGATLPSSGVSDSVLNLASGGGGQGGASDIHLWSLEEDTPISTLQGHSDRVCRVEFHPSGKYLASASFDTTWRLWDVETTTELLLQEGHSRQVYTVAFNTDGSLLASGGFDSIGRIWDLRSGRTVMILEGHIREIYSLDWGIDGYRVLSGSGDGWVKCWDLRAVRNIGGIGAHNGNVSDLRWFKGIDGDMTTKPDVSMENGVRNDTQPRKAGTFFVSSGFDKNVNIYSADDWGLAKRLSGHSGNVLSVDVSSDAKWVASSGHDRTVKIWGRDDGEGI